MANAPDLSRLSRTTDKIFSLEEFKDRLALDRPLRIKYGVDATAPFLHVGHAVNLWMMRELQEQGHMVIFLIGDFTTRIGDPTGKSKTRSQLSPEVIDANAREFIEQVGQVLRTDSRVFTIRRNSEWFDHMGLRDFMSLLSMVTHSKLIQRDMFQKRIQTQQEIYVHEMLYPILQGYDSYMLESDLTIVGSDQLFNEMMGRFYQEKLGQSPQIVITTKITPGIDGTEKQSKSLGNYIALSDTPRDKYGKIMSIPDSLITSYLEVYTNMPLAEVQEIQRMMASGYLNPMEAKKKLAVELVERYHGREAAESEQEWFTMTFSMRKTPNDMPIIQMNPGLSLMEILQHCMPTSSKSKLRSLIRQGAVHLNDRKLQDAQDRPEIRHGDILRVGAMHWFKISLN